MYGITTVTTKGQVTLPEPLRDYLKIVQGTKIYFESADLPTHELKARVIHTKGAVEELAGSLHRPGMKYVPINIVRKSIGAYLAKEMGLTKPTKR